MSTYLSRTPRPQGQHLQTAPTKKVTTPGSQRLNTILETAGSNNRAPRSSRRAPGLARLHNAQRSHLGAPPLESDEKPPPSYSQLSGQGGSLDGDRAREDETKLGKVKRAILGRGGWKRLALIVLGLLLVLIALAVGLGVGLKKQKQQRNAAAASSSASEGTKAPPYPIGSWNFDAVLAEVNTDCTPNAATWTCFPYNTYGVNPSRAGYTFNWIISTLDPEAKKPESLQITSGANAFALNISSTPLRLLDEGTREERYTFSLALPKVVQPMESITDDNAQSICYYNQSILTGNLYRLPESGESGRSDPLPVGSNTVPTSWPGTMFLSYSSPGGADTPDCFTSSGGTSATGPRITEGLTPLSAPNDCSCIFESRNETTTT